MIENLSTILPIVAVTSAVSGFLGWSMRAPAKTTSPAKSAPTADKGQQERVKNLEAALEKSKAAHKGLKSELENLQSTSVTQAAHATTVSELDTVRKAAATEAKRISALETDLRKSQETIKHLNARTNEADKAQKDRRFALENELSKAREGLAQVQNRPDDSAELQLEIDRLRESVAVSTRYAGEMRKREAAAVEALEKAGNRLAELGAEAQPVVSRKIGPVVDSSRIAAAKAEVIRLVELNKQKESVAPLEDIQVIAADVEATAEEVKVVVEDIQVIPQDHQTLAEKAEVVTVETEGVTEEAPAPIKQVELPLVGTLL